MTNTLTPEMAGFVAMAFGGDDPEEMDVAADICEEAGNNAAAAWLREEATWWRLPEPERWAWAFDRLASPVDDILTPCGRVIRPVDKGRHLRLLISTPDRANWEWPERRRADWVFWSENRSRVQPCHSPAFAPAVLAALRKALRNRLR